MVYRNFAQDLAGNRLHSGIQGDGHSRRRRRRTTAIRTFLKETMSPPRMGASFRANHTSVHAEMARYHRDGQTDGFSSLYSRLANVPALSCRRRRMPTNWALCVTMFYNRPSVEGNNNNSNAPCRASNLETFDNHAALHVPSLSPIAS